MTVKPVSMEAKWFKCVSCGAKVIVGDYYLYEAWRLTHQHKCQGCAEGEIKNRWRIRYDEDSNVFSEISDGGIE